MNKFIIYVLNGDDGHQYVKSSLSNTGLYSWFCRPASYPLGHGASNGLNYCWQKESVSKARMDKQKTKQGSASLS